MKKINYHSTRFVWSFCLTICSVCCFIQSNAQTVEDSLNVQRSIEQASKKIGAITTIEDAESIAFIDNYIALKSNQREVEDAKMKLHVEQSLGQRYKQGDYNVIPQMLDILQGNDNEAKNDLLNQLGFDYLERKKDTLKLEPRLQTAIFELLDDDILESAVVQFLGYNRIEGSLLEFEKRLNLEKTETKPRMFYWLAQKGDSRAATKYAISVLENYGNREDNYWYMTSLKDHLQNTKSDSTKAQIIDALFDAIEANQITLEDLEETPKHSFLNNPIEYKSKLYEMISEFGDERSIIYLKNFRDVSIQYLKSIGKEGRVKQLNFEFDFMSLKYQSISVQINKIKSYLRSEDHFQDALYYIFKNDELSEDLGIQETVFSVVSKKQMEHYERENFFKLTEDITKDQFIYLVDNSFRTGSFKDQFMAHYNAYNESLEQKLSYLQNIGLIDDMPSQVQIEVFKETEVYDDFEDSIFSALKLANISFGYDAEPNIIPVDYDELLKQYISITNGQLKDIDVFLDTSVSSDYEQISYQFYVKCKEVYFVMTPQDFGDWYDLARRDWQLRRMCWCHRCCRLHLPRSQN